MYSNLNSFWGGKHPDLHAVQKFLPSATQTNFTVALVSGGVAGLGDCCGYGGALGAQQQWSGSRGNKRRCGRLHVGGDVLQRACGGRPGGGGAGAFEGSPASGGRCSGEAATRGPGGLGFHGYGVRPTAARRCQLAPPARLDTQKIQKSFGIWFCSCSPCIAALICSKKRVLRDEVLRAARLRDEQASVLLHAPNALAAKRSFGATLLACRPPLRMPLILATWPLAMASGLTLSLPVLHICGHGCPPLCAGGLFGTAATT